MLTQIIALFFLTQSARALEFVDLHAHLFMPEASGFPGMGGFYEPLRAYDWSSRLRTRVNAETLERSGVKIVVVALYSHPLFFKSILGNERATIRDEIVEISLFVSTHLDWVIARSPAEARAALHAGKRVMVLSLEGGLGVLENEDDIQEFVDRDGVRIVTPIHFVDSETGGAAFMPSFKILVNPIGAIRSLFDPKRDEQGVRVNSQGLGAKGLQLIQALVHHGAWIDFSHASDVSFANALPIVKDARQPILFTHTILRNAFHAERGISQTELREIADSGGLIGLLPSDDMLEGTQVDPKFCPKPCDGSCEGGRAAFATQWREISKTVPVTRLFLGSDIDAPLRFLRPECDAVEKTSPRGYWSYEQFPELFEFLGRKNLVPTNDPKYMIESFLRAWEKAIQARAT